VDSKAECDRLNLAHIGRKNIYQKNEKTKAKQMPVATYFGTGSRSVVRKE